MILKIVLIIIGILISLFVLFYIIPLQMTKVPKLRFLVQFVFLALVVFLGIKVYNSIMQPIRFNEQKNIRYQATVDVLKQIRSAEVAYRARNGRYTANFDSLIQFIKTDSFAIVTKIGSIPEEFTDSLPLLEAEALALKRGLIQRDTVYVSVLDSLFEPGYDVSKIRYVPLLDEQIEFELAADVINTGSSVKVDVFEAKAHNNVVLKGLDPQEVINLNADAKKLERYPGLKVGDILEPNNNAGNWDPEYDKTEKQKAKASK